MKNTFKPILQDHKQVSTLLSSLPKGDDSDAIHIQALNPETMNRGPQDVVIICDAVGYTDALINAFKGLHGLFTRHVPLTAREVMSEINNTVNPGKLNFTFLPIDAKTITQQEFIEALHAKAIDSQTKDLQLVTIDYLKQLDEKDMAFIFKSA
ncbi:MAG: hypothetical protein CMF37_15410 [Leeuwenhoekiella sp.]|jgi:hypothetical protein|nr:hypothetical protein [Leeuwenhoekiella sp.]MBH14300.1 hypothetical protein [Leeuwenhoekiella sp.]MBQ50193.1 hypothetical protein [Leeuwenhoekiella sp.]MBQ50390.1 hypothetical protein [Leeuwenhoekiella sp.]|tara:strand:- start:7 stop:465 length:459 start_codon:yes stop_codon:yes gene_type:complete